MSEKRDLTAAEKLAEVKKSEKSEKLLSRGRKIVFSCDLKQRRVGLGLSLRDVSEATGMTAATIVDVENGHNLGLDKAFKLSEFFGCSIYDIWKRGE